MSQRKASVLSLLLCAFSMGCAAEQKPLGTRVEGSVTLDGKPVTEGSITIGPARGGRTVSAPITNGRYVAEGVARGPATLHVDATRDTGHIRKLDGLEIPERVSLVPERLKGGIQIELTGEKMIFDIPLDAK